MFSIQSAIFKDGKVYLHKNSEHPALKGLKAAIAALEERQAISDTEELEIMEILTGKSISDLENDVVQYALKSIQAVNDIMKFNMTPVENRMEIVEVQ